MLAALCARYPGYTLETLRDLPLRDLNALIDAATSED